jgi:4-amino-4-deoxy-L-arabinose transferase-like glycosyltransferase
MLAPPLAVCIAGGLARLRRKARIHPWLAAASLLVLSSGTLLYQAQTAYSYTGNNSWIWAAALMLACGILAEVIGILARKNWLKEAGFCLLAFAVLAAPVVWSIRTTSVENPHTGLPGSYAGETENRQAGSGQKQAPYRLQFLMDQTADMEYLLAVPGSMQGAEYVLAVGRPVLYIGGFNGGDPVLTLEEFQDLIKNGSLRFVLVSGGNNQSENAEIFRWVRTTCTVLPFGAAADGNQLPAEQQKPALFDCIGTVDG